VLYAGKDGWTARLIPLAAVDVEWPFAGSFLGGVQTISPRVQFVASHATANATIPNEDSRAVDLEESNLFALNRFPGFDRWEGGARITYGADWRWARPGLVVAARLGQSYRLDGESSLFPEGTGLSGRLSDFVGRVSFRFGRYIELTQRLRLDKDDLAVRRNELDVAVGSRRTFLSLGYLRFNRNITLEDLTDHEEVRAGARVAFGKYWAVFGSAVVDLTSTQEDPLTTNDGWQPIRGRIGISYTDECFDIGLTIRRNYVDQPNQRRGNVIQFTLALRNLG
jgi:LPS-assembly protein